MAKNKKQNFHQQPIKDASVSSPETADTQSKVERELKPTIDTYNQMESEFAAAEEYQKKHKDDPHCSWKEKEALLLGRNLDALSNQTKSQVFDPRLSTIIIERMNRVMAQHATGKVRAIDNVKDKLPTLILDLALQRYIIPNADSQYDLLTKFKLQDFYSLAYGSYVSLVDYRVDEDYIGPDSWLLPIRHYYPEANAINERNHEFIDTWVSRRWFEKRNRETWENIDLILKTLDERGSEKETEQQSLAEQENHVSYAGKKKNQQIHLRTKYECDRWTTYAVDAQELKDKCICRDIPRDDGELPTVVKHAFPLMDRFYGLGEFERGKTLQYAINSVWNLSLDGKKMAFFPPRIVDMAGVVPSSLGYHPGATWIETKPNSIRPWNVGGASEQAFQSTYSALVAATLNQAGTTNIATADVVDPGSGKTPAAIKSMGARESSRDAWDRYLMEQTVGKTFNKMIDLLVKKQEKPINFDLLEGEIRRLQMAFPGQYEQFAEIFESRTYGKMKVEKGTLGGGQFKYRFDVDTGTTGKKDQQEEHESLSEIMTVVSKLPGALEEAKQTGKITLGNKVIDFGELLQSHIMTSGTSNWEKIISDSPNSNQDVSQAAATEEPMDEQTTKMMGELSQAFGGQVPQVMPPAQNATGMEMGGMQ